MRPLLRRDCYSISIENAPERDSRAIDGRAMDLDNLFDGQVDAAHCASSLPSLWLRAMLSL